MYDVIVLGLGAMGSAAAYHLAARGKRVLGLERFSAAHDLGSSHGDSRIIRQAYHEHPSYVPLAQRSYQLWERLEQDSGRSMLERTGGLMVGPPGSPVVEGAILSATQHNLPFEVLTAGELKNRFPAFRPRDNETAMFEAAAGFLRPEVAIHAHLQMASQCGAELHFHEPVKAWSATSSGDSVTVTTEMGVYQAARLVLAPGAWAPQILSELQVKFDVRRHVMCWFQPLGNTAIFRSNACPIYIWDVDGANCFYGFPITGGMNDGVKVAMHSGGQRCTADTVNRDISEADIDELRDYLKAFIPALSGPYSRAVVCLYTLTPDQHFVVSLHPSYRQVSIAAGFSGHGFKFSCVIGEALADLAIDERTRSSFDFLSPQRFSGMFNSFASLGAEVSPNDL